MGKIIDKIKQLKARRDARVSEILAREDVERQRKNFENVRDSEYSRFYADGLAYRPERVDGKFSGFFIPCIIQRMHDENGRGMSNYVPKRNEKGEIIRISEEKAYEIYCTRGSDYYAKNPTKAELAERKEEVQKEVVKAYLKRKIQSLFK